MTLFFNFNKVSHCRSDISLGGIMVKNIGVVCGSLLFCAFSMMASAQTAQVSENKQNNPAPITLKLRKTGFKSEKKCGQYVAKLSAQAFKNPAILFDQGPLVEVKAPGGEQTVYRDLENLKIISLNGNCFAYSLGFTHVIRRIIVDAATLGVNDLCNLIDEADGGDGACYRGRDSKLRYQANIDVAASLP